MAAECEKEGIAPRLDIPITPPRVFFLVKAQPPPPVSGSLSPPPPQPAPMRTSILFVVALLAVSAGEWARVARGRREKKKTMRPTVTGATVWPPPATASAGAPPPRPSPAMTHLVDVARVGGQMRGVGP